MPRHATSTSFVIGHTPHNKIREHRRDLCPDCKINLKVVYSKRCRDCAYAFRRDNVGRRVYKSGYVYEEGGKRPRPEHIVKAEKALGRPLKTGEQVHHIDLNKSNDKNTNLLICTAAYHKWLHHQYALAFARRFFRA